MNLLHELLTSKARAEIFRLLFEQKDAEIYLREIQRQSGLSLTPIQVELKKLSKLGLIQTRKDGNRLYYRSNLAHPLYPEIHQLVEKTSGYKMLLKEALRVPGIRFAFIFGSVAARTERAESDLDLFIVGDLGLRQVTKLLQGISQKVGREINPHVMTQVEISRKIRAKEHFISSVLESKKVFLIGDEREFKDMG